MGFQKAAEYNARRRTIQAKIYGEMIKIGDMTDNSMRFGQIIANVLPDRLGNDPYYISDEELLDAIVEFRRRIQGGISESENHEGKKNR